MDSLNYYVTNSSGSLDRLLGPIESAFSRAAERVVKDFILVEVDVIFVDAPYLAIPELGLGGYTPGSNLIYINLDPSHDVLDKYPDQLIHELKMLKSLA